MAQPLEFTTLPTGEHLLHWYGFSGRSYFIQASDAEAPLAKWKWCPLIESGNNETISHEADGTAEKGFFRLKYTDQVPGPGETLETADFDNDGISNLDEIEPQPPLEASDATDPLDADTDHDDLPDGWERAHGLDPNDDGSIDPNNGPNGDPDNDGVSNFQEYQSGTDSRNGGDFPLHMITADVGILDRDYPRRHQIHGHSLTSTAGPPIRLFKAMRTISAWTKWLRNSQACPIRKPLAWHRRDSIVIWR